MAGPGIASVDDLDLCAGDQEVVHQPAGCPALVRAGAGPFSVCGRVDHHIRAGNACAQRQRVIRAVKREILAQQTLPIETHARRRGLRSLAGVFDDGVNDRAPLGSVIEDDLVCRESVGGDVVDPSIGDVVPGHRSGRVQQIDGAGGVGIEVHVLNADLVDPSAPRIAMDRPSSVLRVERIGERDVDGDGVAVDGRDDAIPVLVLRACGPLGGSAVGIGNSIHADGVNPVGRARAVDEDGVADVQVGRATDVEGTRADGNVAIGDGVGRS